MRLSSFIIFDKHPVNLSEIPYDITLFELESDDETGLNEKLNEMIENLNKITVDYGLRNQDTGEMIVYVEFVGVLDIRFDNIKIIEKDTYKKIDEMKDLKTEFGTSKGYKPHFRPIEGQFIENMDITPEKIYFYSHSQENLLKLKDLLTKKIIEINPDFEIGFKQFSEDDLY